jgi:hypothetical protein
MLKKLELEKLTASSKKRFIEMQLNDEIKIHKREIIEINRDLHRHKFTTQAELTRLHDELEANVRSIVNYDEPDEEEQDPEANVKEKENEFA